MIRKRPIEEVHDNLYEVEKILDRRRRRVANHLHTTGLFFFLAKYKILHTLFQGRTEYLVKWKGWDAAHNSWEKSSDVFCDELIAEFENKDDSSCRRSKKAKLEKEEAELEQEDMDCEERGDESFCGSPPSSPSKNSPVAEVV